MAKQYTCDFCGQSITDDRLMVVVRATGNQSDSDGCWGGPGNRYIWVSGEVGHYHATEDEQCWGEMLDRLGLIHDVSSSLGATTLELQQRREHRVEQARDATERDEQHSEYLERRRSWRQSPMAYRERVVLEALGDGRMTLGELSTGMNEALGWSANRVIYEAAASSLARRMVASGQLGREPEEFRGKVRYRYFAKRTLEGPIVALDDALGVDGHGVA
jgi:hypothetical protein